MTHDPLCPAKNDPDPKCHSCHLIDKVRQDMLARCIAAVEAQQMYASTVEEIMVGFDCAKREILRALRALQEMP
jgi:hypothetical protein